LHASTVNCQSFTTKAIGQSTPLPGVTNRITVTLVSDTDLSGNSGGDKVTISGLSGAVASSPVTLLAAGESGDNGFLIFSDGAVQSRGVWNSTTGSLTLTVQTGATFTKSTTYTFSFDITNPSSDMTSPTVNIEASGSVTIASSAMSKPGGAKYGVVNGEHPLTVAVPAWSTKSIAQGTPVPDQNNLLTVTLRANYDLIAGSTVTISGLANTQTATESSLTIFSSGKFGSVADWNSDGVLKLTVATSQTVPQGQEAQITFSLRNRNSANSSPTVNIAANIVLSDGGNVDMAMSVMEKAGGDLYGVANGSHPLKVVVPAWDLKSIMQNTPFSDAINTLTVTLAANYHLADGSTVTISGLTGSQTQSTALLPRASTAG